ncbi:MAG TPA: hypothetical protein VEI83_10630 [Acidimicrobiales bacterium]|nr:hypothetical protein [Acidimicrobiales bacterium]
MDESFEQARVHRRGLRAAIGGVEGALTSPATEREAAWSASLREQVAVLSDALDRHIEYSEGPEGLLTRIVADAPRLMHRVQQARADHDRLRSETTELLEALDDGEGVDKVRDRTMALLAGLVRHRHIGSDLVYEAYMVDIEASD